MGILFVAVVLIFVLFILFLATRNDKSGDKVVDKVADRAIPVEVWEGVEDNSDFLDFIKQSWYGDYKLNQLPKSFKIGNVYFDKVLSNCTFYEESYREYKGGIWSSNSSVVFSINIIIQSYVKVEGKVYDNGELIHTVNRHITNGFRGYTHIKTTTVDFKNEDLCNYILNNLDKVEEVN